jgi:hypothetical protein
MLSSAFVRQFLFVEIALLHNGAQVILDVADVMVSRPASTATKLSNSWTISAKSWISRFRLLLRRSPVKNLDCTTPIEKKRFSKISQGHAAVMTEDTEHPGTGIPLYQRCRSRSGSTCFFTVEQVRERRRQRDMNLCYPVPEFIDPVFTKTSPKRSFSFIQNERFGLVFAKTRSINSGTGRWWLVSYFTKADKIK